MKAKIFYVDRSSATIGNVVSVEQGIDSIVFFTRSIKEHVAVDSEVEVASSGIMYVEITDNGKFVELIPGAATAFKIVPCGEDFEKATRVQAEIERVAASRAKKKKENEERLRLRYRAKAKSLHLIKSLKGSQK